MNLENSKKDLKARVEQLDEVFKKDKQQREKYEKIAFSPNKIAKALSYLLLAMEDKVYIPVGGSSLENGKCYYYLTLVYADELAKKSNNIPFTNYEDQILLFYEQASILDCQILDDACLTFKHLLTKYSVDLCDAKNNGLKICKDSFAERTYFKDFINQLAELQIEMSGKHLTEKEVLIALSQFIKLKNEKPKTKELKKD